MRNAKTLAILLVTLLSVANSSLGWAGHTDRIKQAIDSASDSLKRAVDEVGDDLVAVQNYLDNYHWKGLVQDEATSDMATLKHLHLNGHSRAVVVRPGERVEGIVQCNLDRERCASFSLYRIVIGIQGKGPQTTIGSQLGLAAGESLERFTLIAPAEPGLYQVRFRLAKAVLESTAFEAWRDEKGNEPDAKTTIGVILVK